MTAPTVDVGVEREVLAYLIANWQDWPQAAGLEVVDFTEGRPQVFSEIERQRREVGEWNLATVSEGLRQRFEADQREGEPGWREMREGLPLWGALDGPFFGPVLFGHKVEDLLRITECRQWHLAGQKLMDGQDPEEVIRHAAERRRVQASLVSVRQAWSEMLDRYELIAGGRRDMVRMGLSKLDALLGGLEPGSLVVCGARTSVGKTAFGLTVAHQVAKAGHSVIVFSLEMSAVQVTERLTGQILGMEPHLIRTGRLPEREVGRLVTEAPTLLASLPIHVVDRAGLQTGEAEATIAKMPPYARPRLVVFDYLGLAGDKADSEYLRLGLITRRLKEAALRQQFCCLALVQLNRQVEHRADKVPGLADIRDSGQIEEHADAVLLLHRAKDGKGSLIVAKNRNGPTGKVTMWFDDRTTRWGEVEATGVELGT